MMSPEIDLDDEIKKFPDYFPSGCPPATAKDSSGECFRIVKTSPMTDDDFKSYKELDKLPNANQCKRCGVSVFDSAANAKFHLDLRPDLGTVIAKATLDNSHGKLSDASGSGSGHMEWWPYAHVNRRALFQEMSA